ncbi:extracellular solute-binding protein [Paenibacillus durus]|uniref:extracellular solute-binding protein n=1 Tax=Paenibacillus durus TaxID=44251 RepID=UPI0004B8E8D7|nr:extracellular solute-binding protein [Paenibacillus durus]
MLSKDRNAPEAIVTRSKAEEISGWKTKKLSEGGAYATPFVWKFKQGANILRIGALKETAALESITLRPALTVPAYSQVRASYPPSQAAKGTLIELEAEKYAQKNSTSILNQYNRDPLTTPESMSKVAMNALGGFNWSTGGQAVSWTLDVPEDGLYKIALRAKASNKKNQAVFRTISIDGQVPFQELLSYKFPYNSEFKGVTLSDGQGKPFEFYLTKGTHMLTMEATYAPYMPIIMGIEQTSHEVRNILLEIRTITGNREDKYRVWDVSRDMPGMTERLQALEQQFIRLAAEMKSINPLTNDVTQAFRNSIKDLDSLLKKPDSIPNSQTRIAAIQQSIDAIVPTLKNSSLLLDKIYVAEADSKLPRMKSSFFENVRGSFTSLAASFKNREKLDNETGELNVWMMMGRDYIDELQSLADQQFTPETGIKVKVNLIQNADVLTMANAAGIMPDVALGVPQGLPFDMALRNATLNLSEMPGADQFFTQFSPGVLQPFYWKGGYYAVPETINFKVLFYRKDILKSLNLDVPDTWDDVLEALPTLMQNQYSFYMDPKDFTAIFFQNHVNLYAPNGLETGLNSPEAFKAFKMWTDFYTVQGLDRVVQSFYNNFRRGDMPMGISDFNQYMQLLVAAPEIAGNWGIAPIPGTKAADGTIERWSGGSNPSNAMLFKTKSTERQQQAWEFLRWYMSPAVQTEFGLNLEQYYGEQFRWNSSNIQAFASLPWKEEDLNVILEQWKWTEEIPSVPGGYMLDRELQFAWNRVVVSGDSPRMSLEQSIKEINRELKRKLTEFNLIGEGGEGNVTLDLPQVNSPWKGVGQIVR